MLTLDTCQSPAVAGRTRCRMHGGAGGSGAPKGKRKFRKAPGGVLPIVPKEI
ncbi:MAG: HGGxSTG domain-containing protein [Methylocella sp.]